MYRKKTTLLGAMLSVLLATLFTVSASAVTGGSVGTLAGGEEGDTDGAVSVARFRDPYGVAVGPDGTVYVSEFTGHRIRAISPAGVVSTLAGSGFAGYADGVGESTRFNHPIGLALDAERQVLYVADTYSHRIRSVDLQTRAVTTLAGGSLGFADGFGVSARFRYPMGVAVQPGTGDVLVADTINQRIRRIDPDTAAVTTVAGSELTGNADGPAEQARFRGPRALDVDAAGRIWVADTSNHRIRRIADGTVTTVAGSAAGHADGAVADARFFSPHDVAVADDGTLYVTDTYNHRIRAISPDGQVNTVAGSGEAGSVDGDSTTAQFFYPFGLAVDGDRLLIAQGNTLFGTLGDDHRIRTVSLGPVDSTPPQLNLPTAPTVQATGPDGAPVSFTATATDDTDGAVPLSCDRASGSLFAVGDTIVTCTATDAAGNTATGQFTVRVRYGFNGFFAPVNGGSTVNVTKAGRAIPIKFNLSGNMGLNVFKTGWPKSVASTGCTGTEDAIESTETAGNSSLSYDATANQYNYVWKTDTAWAGSCRKLSVAFNDGTERTLLFQFTK